jgi:nucleoside-diphosphate-sugar epimerase
MKSKKIKKNLLIDGAGFIGSNLVDELINRGYKEN